jgi:5-formyltetrahydrofolate cyclo-ligase
LRRSLKARRDSLSNIERESFSAAICQYLKSFWLSEQHAILNQSVLLSSPQKTSLIVAGYSALHSEANIFDFLKYLAYADSPLSQATELCLPAIEESNEEQKLIFRRWAIGDPVQKAAFGTQEPLPAAPRVTPAVILVPLLGVDHQGYRLGYGKGFYDRYFEACKQQESQTFAPPLAIGIAFECQVCASVFPESHDLKLDYLVTETGFRHIYGNLNYK